MLVSVIVPTFNRVVALSQCLETLRAQSLPRQDYELIVVDDGSTDGTADWLSQQHDLRVLRTAHRGAASARNAGARRAQGDMLAFTDDDCLVPPTWLCRLCTALAEADVVGGRIVNGSPANLFAATSQAIVDALTVELNHDMRNGGMLTSNNVAYRRAIFEAAGGYDERFVVGGEDRELHDRLWRRSARLRYLPEIVVQHNASPSLRQFLLQHYTYGRGAWIYYHQVPAPPHLPPAFYGQLAARIGQGQSAGRRTAMRAALAASQCAVLCGYLSTALAHRGLISLRKPL